jgi:hypothetical protein
MDAWPYAVVHNFRANGEEIHKKSAGGGGRGARDPPEAGRLQGEETAKTADGAIRKAGTASGREPGFGGREWPTAGKQAPRTAGE